MSDFNDENNNGVFSSGTPGYTPVDNGAENKRSKHGHGKIIALALVVSLLAGAAGSGGVMALSGGGV